MPPRLSFSGDPNAARTPAFAQEVKRAVGLDDDIPVQFQASRGNLRGGLTLEFSAVVPMELHGAAFGPADGACVDVPSSLSLSFDQDGALISHQVSPVDARSLELVKDQVRKLAETGQIDPVPTAASEGQVAPAPRKQWHIELDPRGRKRVKRTFMA